LIVLQKWGVTRRPKYIGCAPQWCCRHALLLGEIRDHGLLNTRGRPSMASDAMPMRILIELGTV